jgi:hypothetical protein
MTEPIPEPIIENLRPNLPDWGVYLRWPENGQAWIHPDDISIVVEMIPSHRVYQRMAWDGAYYTLKYGSITFRVKPSMWLRVPAIDLQVGEQIELLSNFSENDAGIFHIRDILFNPVSGEIEYRLQHSNMPIPRSFSRDDLKPIHVDHQLRRSDFSHPPQSSIAFKNVNNLDVGNLSDES